jgi:hypothetical protein
MSRRSSRVDFKGMLGAEVLASVGSIVMVIGIGRFATDVVAFLCATRDSFSLSYSF